MKDQELAEVAAETANLDFCAIHARALHELLQQSHLISHPLAQMLVDVVGVKRSSVSCASPISTLHSVAWHDVHSDSFNYGLQIRMFGKPLNLRRALCGFSGNR